jgi:hypothetical protein
MGMRMAIKQIGKVVRNKRNTRQEHIDSIYELYLCIKMSSVGFGLNWRRKDVITPTSIHLHFHIDTTSKMKHGNEMDFQTMKRRRFIDVETTSIQRRWNDVDFSTLKRRRFLNVDSVCVCNPFSTSIRRHSLTSFRRCFDVALAAGI